MKLTSCSAFFQQVQDTPKEWVLPVYLIVAKDLSFRSWLLEHLLKMFSKNVKRYTEQTASHLQTELMQTNLFSTKQHLVFSAETPSKETLHSLACYLEQPKSQQVLLIAFAQLLPTSSLFKLAEKQGVVVAIPELKVWEKERVLTEVLTVRKVRMEHSLIKKFLHMVHFDPLLMERELEKIELYTKGEKQITEEMLQAICLDEQEETVFQVVDEIVEGKAAAFSGVTHLLSSQGSPILLLRCLRQSFGLLYEIRQLMEQKAPYTAVQKKYPYLKGKILDQKVRQAKRFSLDEMAKKLVQAESLELLYKTGSRSDEMFMDLLVAELL